MSILCKSNSVSHSELVSRGGGGGGGAACSLLLIIVLGQCLQHFAFSSSASSLSVTWIVIYKYTVIPSFKNIHWVAARCQTLCRALGMNF